MSNVAQHEATAEEVGTLARGTFTNVAARIYNFASRLLFNLLVARLLGPEHLGVLFVALTVAGGFGVLVTAGLDGIVLRYLACYRADRDWGAHRGTLRFAVGAVSLSGFIGFLALVLLAPWIATALFHRPALIWPLRIMALYGPLFGLMTVLLSATQSFNEMKYRAFIASVVDPTFRIGVVIGALLLGGGLYTVLIGYILSTLLCMILSVFALRSCLPGDWSEYPARLDRRELWRYGGPLFGGEILGFLILYVDALILGHFRSFQEVGVYSVCLRLMLICGSMLPLLEQAFAPLISEFHHRGEMTKISTCSKLVTLWAVEAYIPMMLLLLVVPRQVLGLFGKSFEVAAPALLILASAYLISVATGPASMILNMSGWTGLEMLNMASVVLVQIVLCLLLAPRVGFVGAAIADASALVGIKLIRLVQLRRRLGIYPFSSSIGKPLVAGAAALVVTVPMWGRPAPMLPFQLVLVPMAVLLVYAGLLAAFGFERESRLAGQELWRSFGRIVSHFGSRSSIEREIE